MYCIYIYKYTCTYHIICVYIYYILLSCYSPSRAVGTVLQAPSFSSEVQLGQIKIGEHFQAEHVDEALQDRVEVRLAIQGKDKVGVEGGEE